VAYRIDATPIGKAEKLPNGFLRAPAFLSREGIFRYVVDGKQRLELRPPEEVFHKDALDSFELVPLVDNHPREGAVDDKNAVAVTVGAVGKVRQDGNKVAGELLVYDGRTVEKMFEGKRELSCGYTCDTDETPGVWKGQRYDAVQRNIRANHVALVDVGRAGPEVKVRLDAPEAGVLVFSSEQRDTMTKFRIDGVEVELSELAAQLITKERTASAGLLDQVKGERDAMKAQADKASARADAAEAQITALKAEVAKATAPDAIASAVKARVSLESEARTVLGADFKADGISDVEIRKQVVMAADPKAVLEGKSPEYVQARYDAAIEYVARTNPATLEAARKIVEAPKPRADAQLSPEQALLKAIAERHQNTK
jgi:hypothetical protein